VALPICQALPTVQSSCFAGLQRRKIYGRFHLQFANQSAKIIWLMEKQQPSAQSPTAMPRTSDKIVPLKPKAPRAAATIDMPDLSVILADLKKILHEDGLLPQHKH
jgi:hypothetical protein